MLSEIGRRGISLASTPCLLARLPYVSHLPQTSIAIPNRNDVCRKAHHSAAYGCSKLVLIQPSFLGSPPKCRHCLEQSYHRLPRDGIVWLPRRFLASTCVPWQQKKAVTERKTSQGDQQLTMGKKVAEASQTVSYAGVILVGLGVIGMVIFTLGKELFSSHSPNGVYTKTLKLCKKNLEIQDSLGTPIKGYGEMTRRKRRRHVSHLEYSQGGVNYLRMKFYLEGPERKGTVHLEMMENESGQYEYRYLFVELDGYPSRTIVLEDNR